VTEKFTAVHVNNISWKNTQDRITNNLAIHWPLTTDENVMEKNPPLQIQFHNPWRNGATRHEINDFWIPFVQ
jgi:hypothetical protein